MKTKMKEFTLNGRTMSALDFLRAARAEFDWLGLIPSRTTPFKSENGDKGVALNRDAPPADICRQAKDAWFALSEDEMDVYKREVHSA